MHNPGINGEGELRGQLANPGSSGKMAVKTVCVCVCVSRWTWVSWYQYVSILDFIGAKDDGGGYNWGYKTCKAPVKMSPPTNQNPVF